MKAEFCRKILEPNLIENEPRSNFSVCERNIRSNTLENKQSNLYDLKFVQEASKYKVIVFEDQEQMDLCTKKLNELGFFKEPTKDFTQFTYQGSEYNGCPTIVVPPEMYNVLKDISGKNDPILFARAINIAIRKMFLLDDLEENLVELLKTKNNNY